MFIGVCSVPGSAVSTLDTNAFNLATTFWGTYDGPPCFIHEEIKAQGDWVSQVAQLLDAEPSSTVKPHPLAFESTCACK